MQGMIVYKGSESKTYIWKFYKFDLSNRDERAHVGSWNRSHNLHAGNILEVLRGDDRGTLSFTFVS